MQWNFDLKNIESKNNEFLWQTLDDVIQAMTGKTHQEWIEDSSTTYHQAYLHIIDELKKRLDD